MIIFSIGGLVVLVLFVGLICFFARLLSKAVAQITKTNNQLLILIAGQSGKPEATGGIMRALVASEKSPRGKLAGVTTPKKTEKKKSNNVDCQMSIGVP